jgi:hypothetical protein
LINSKSPKSPQYTVGDKTLDALEAFAADSGYSLITVENDKIEFRLKKSKSPINRLFQDVKSFLGFKKKVQRKNNNKDK